MPLTKEKMRDYMRERRKKNYAEKMESVKDEVVGTLPDGRPKYVGREYRENGSVELFEQRCPLEGCNGLWSASIAIPCPYCSGTGKRRYA